MESKRFRKILNEKSEWNIYIMFFQPKYNATIKNVDL